MCAHLRVGVQYADTSSLHHLMYGVDLDSIQVAVVLSVFKEAPIFDVGLHLAAAGEGVHAILTISLFGLSGGVLRDTKNQSSMHMHFPFPFGSLSLFLLLIKAI